MRVAIVHDYLNQYGGAEQVLEAMHDLFPEAPVYTMIHKPEALPERFQGWDIRPSEYISRLPFLTRHYKKYLLLYPRAVEQFDLNEYDLVISSSYLWTKGVITAPHTLHICYCYTPMRQAYYRYHEYYRYEKVPWLMRLMMPRVMHYLRMWDNVAASRVDRFVSISNNISKQIRKYYRRESEVIYPPVRTDYFSPNADGSYGDYFLMVGRLVAYKRPDIAISAFNKLGLPLKVVGTGPMLKKLKSTAGRNIEFLGQAADEQVRELYKSCKAFVFPGEEDFGITPVEAMAGGRPVIAYAGGGLLETVVPGDTGNAGTGVFFEKPDPESLAAAVRNFDPEIYDPAAIAAHARKFDTSVFKDRLRWFVKEAYEEYRKKGPDIYT